MQNIFKLVNKLQPKILYSAKLSCRTEREIRYFRQVKIERYPQEWVWNDIKGISGLRARLLLATLLALCQLLTWLIWKRSQSASYSIGLFVSLDTSSPFNYNMFHLVDLNFCSTKEASALKYIPHIFNIKWLQKIL